MKKRFRQNAKAWKYFEAQPPYYRRLAAWWIISARRDETREKRLVELIRVSAEETRLAPFATTSQNKTK